MGSRLLVLPLSLLLFLQWPLRELVHAYSREANDLAQILFALYVAVAVTVATSHGAHLTADALAHRYPPAWRHRLDRIAAALVLVPWSFLVLYHGAMPAWRSVCALERFQDTLNPGYFLIRCAVLLLAIAVLGQAVRHLLPSRQPS